MAQLKNLIVTGSSLLVGDTYLGNIKSGTWQGDPIGSEYLPLATTTTSGLLSAEDKTKIDGYSTSKEDTSNKTISISESSTDAQYPSAKAVYDYIQSLNGNNTSY